MSNSSDHDRPSLAELAGRLSQEIEAQSRAVAALHDLATGLEGHEAIVLAQTIDIATQHLTALAAIVSRLGGTAEDGAPMPAGLAQAVETLPLSDLRDRLLGRDPAGEGATSGELDLF